MLDSGDATYVIYNPTTDTLTKDVINGYQTGFQKLFPSLEFVNSIIEDTVDSDNTSATKIKTNNLLDSAGNSLIKNTDDNEVIYTKYDKVNMRYRYYCIHCDHFWKN